MMKISFYTLPGDEVYRNWELKILPNFEVICDLLLNKRTATWTLFEHTMINTGSDTLAMFFHCLELIFAIHDLLKRAI